MNKGVGKRVIVIGSSNAGKSTLGQALAEHMGVPFIELDALHWEPGWVMAERAAFRERVHRAIEPESWVLAGNYFNHQQDVSWPVADTVIWLDLSLTTVLRRCVVRSWQRWRTQENLWDTGNRESFLEHLMIWNTDKSLIAYTIKTHHRRRRELAQVASDDRWSHIAFIRLRSAAQIRRLLNALPLDHPVAHQSQAVVAADGAGGE